MISRRNELDGSYDRTILALALARQGKLNEARAAIELALAFHRSLLAGGSEDVQQHFQLAIALYAAALASPPQAPGLLPEAKRIIDGLPPAIARQKSVTRVRGWITEEMARRP
jgi:hypothetical protein